MSKGKNNTKNHVDGKSASSAKTVAKRIGRDASTGQFVVGRSAFAKISAVEGVFLSESMEAEFRRLETVSPEHRRQELARKYGKE